MNQYKWYAYVECIVFIPVMIFGFIWEMTAGWFEVGRMCYTNSFEHRLKEKEGSDGKAV